MDQTHCVPTSLKNNKKYVQVFSICTGMPYLVAILKPLNFTRHKLTKLIENIKLKLCHPGYGMHLLGNDKTQKKLPLRPFHFCAPAVNNNVKSNRNIVFSLCVSSRYFVWTFGSWSLNIYTFHIHLYRPLNHGNKSKNH